MYRLTEDDHERWHLLISYSSRSARVKGLSKTGRDALNLECVTRLAEGMERLKKDGIEAVLVDLTLPDSQGIETFLKLHRAAPHIPMMVLGDERTEDLCEQALRLGAQDYLLNDHLDSYALARALNGAIGRKAVEDALFVEKERAQVTLNSIGDVLSTDIAGNVTYLNVVAERMTGWWREEAMGRPLSEVFCVVDGQTQEPVPDPTQMAIRQNQTVGLSANSVLIRRAGAGSGIEGSAAPIHDRSGRVTGAVIGFHHVSALRTMTLKMSHLAQHDFLTA